MGKAIITDKRGPSRICKAIFAWPRHSQVAPPNSLVSTPLRLGCGHRLYLTIDLEEGGSCMHSVENRKGHGQVDHNYPGFKAKDSFLQSVVVLRAAAKGGRDPELQEKRRGSQRLPGVPHKPWCWPELKETESHATRPNCPHPLSRISMQPASALSPNSAWTLFKPTCFSPSSRPSPWSSPWSLVSPPGLLQSLPRPPTPGGTFNPSPCDPRNVSAGMIFIKHPSDLVAPLRVTHQGSVCLQEKVQISSVIRQLSTSSRPLSLISLCPARLCTAPNMPFFPQSSGLCPCLFLYQGLPVFLLLLSPTFFQVWRHPPLQEALLDLTSQAGTSSVFPQPHHVFPQWCSLFLLTHLYISPLVLADPGPMGLGWWSFFWLVLGLERQPRPCPHPPDQGEKHCLGFLPLTDYDLTSPSLGFLICNTGILTPVSGLRWE